MKILSKKEWNYILYEKNGQYIFSVICGTVAQFEVEIKFNVEEIDRYNSEGEYFLDLYAENLRNNPSMWANRKI